MELPESQVGLAQMLKGGVIMDVVNPEEARIAEEAGAVAVMALERVPADIRKEGGVARMSDPEVRDVLCLVVACIACSSWVSTTKLWQPVAVEGLAWRSPAFPLAWVQMIKAIKAAVTIPVMAKSRIGHFVEAQILEALGIDYIDESEVLTPADDIHHTNKHNFKVPFVCGCRDLGEALRRIAEGAAMIRTKVSTLGEETQLPCTHW